MIEQNYIINDSVAEFAFHALPSEKQTEIHETKSQLFDDIGSSQLFRNFLKSLWQISGSNLANLTILASSGILHKTANYPELDEFALSKHEIIGCYLHEHPVFALHQKELEQRKMTVAKITDFIPHSEFKKTNLFQKAYHLIKFDYMMAAGAWDENGVLYGLCLIHPTRDFTEIQRNILKVIFPSFLKAYRIHNLLLKRQSEITELQSLSRKEKEVLQWVGQGKTNDEIALLENKSSRTLEKQILSISRKLGFKNRSSLIRYASANGQIQFLGLEE